MAAMMLRGPHRHIGAFPRFYGSGSRPYSARYGSYDRIGATCTDPVRRGGTGHDTSSKRQCMERRRSCHAREIPLPLAEGGIEVVAALPYRGGLGTRGGMPIGLDPTDRWAKPQRY